MKNKIIQKMALLTCIVALGIATPGMTSLAATKEGVEVSYTYDLDPLKNDNDKMYGTYYHQNNGGQMRIELTGKEVHKQTKQVWSKETSQTTYGSVTYVYTSTEAHEAYMFYYVEGEGKLNGVVSATASVGDANAY